MAELGRCRQYPGLFCPKCGTHTQQWLIWEDLRHYLSGPLLYFVRNEGDTSKSNGLFRKISFYPGGLFCREIRGAHATTTVALGSCRNLSGAHTKIMVALGSCRNLIFGGHTQSQWWLWESQWWLWEDIFEIFPSRSSTVGASLGVCTMHAVEKMLLFIRALSRQYLTTNSCRYVLVAD